MFYICYVGGLEPPSAAAGRRSTIKLEHTSIGKILRLLKYFQVINSCYIKVCRLLYHADFL